MGFSAFLVSITDTDVRAERSVLRASLLSGVGRARFTLSTSHALWTRGHEDVGVRCASGETGCAPSEPAKRLEGGGQFLFASRRSTMSMLAFQFVPTFTAMLVGVFAGLTTTYLVGQSLVELHLSEAFGTAIGLFLLVLGSMLIWRVQREHLQLLFVP